MGFQWTYGPKNQDLKGCFASPSRVEGTYPIHSLDFSYGTELNVTFGKEKPLFYMQFYEWEEMMKEVIDESDFYIHSYLKDFKSVHSTCEAVYEENGDLIPEMANCFQ